MKRIIETSKGKFCIGNDTDYEFESLLYFYKAIKLTEITEEQASEIVEQESIGFGSSILKSSLDSLRSLLESQGIEITNNTYIFKV